jgi:DnaJ-class molecular chaperone
MTRTEAEWWLMPCDVCGGDGEELFSTGPEQCDVDSRPCPECGGTGRVVGTAEPVECDDIPGGA